MTIIIDNLMVLAAVAFLACSVLVCVIGEWCIAAMVAGLWLLVNAALLLRTYQLGRRRQRDDVA